jgi:hypothetical protein
MLALPLGLRLRYRRRDELVVGRRRRAHPSPRAHGLQIRNTNRGLQRPEQNASRTWRKAQRCQRWSAVFTGSRWREGSALPVGLAHPSRSLAHPSRSDSGPMSSAERNASASSASTGTRRGSSPAARADPTAALRTLIASSRKQWLSCRTEATGCGGSANRARLHGGDATGASGRRGGRGRATRRRRAKSGVPLGEEHPSTLIEYGQSGDLAPSAVD